METLGTTTAMRAATLRVRRKLVLYPEGTGRDLVPFIDSFDEQSCLGCRDFAGFDYFDFVAALAESFDQLLLRGRDAIEAGQHQPGGCLDLAGDVRLRATPAAACRGSATPLCGRCAQRRAPTRESSRHPDRPVFLRGGS